MAKDNGIFHFKWVKSGLNIDFIYFEPYVGHHDASVTLWGHLGKKLRIDYNCPKLSIYALIWKI